jgi:histone deacetylase complex subunit SAP18
MVEASPPILPDPAIGTRLAFRLIYADTRATTRLDLPPRFVTKDLGSIVLGEGGPGADEGAAAAASGDDSSSDGAKTLADARFMTGDYISCAILPPNELTGEVTPATSARMGRGAGVGEARSAMGVGPPTMPRERQRDYGTPYGGFRGRGFRGGYGRGGYGGGGRFPDRDEGFGRGGGRMPEGEWRRGDRLPDDEPPESARWGR